MSGSVGAGGVTAGTTSGINISDKVVKPADILYLNLLCDDILKDRKLMRVCTFVTPSGRNDNAILENYW